MGENPQLVQYINALRLIRLKTDIGIPSMQLEVSTYLWGGIWQPAPVKSYSQLNGNKNTKVLPSDVVLKECQLSLVC